jgi:FlaG/FlaF family flagellin (archaellin)
MKGISTILAMILIVIIVVALIGLTYTFAVGLFSTTTGTATNQVTTTTTRLDKQVSFIGTVTCGNYSGNSNSWVIQFTIRHNGASNYINDATSQNELTAILDSSVIDDSKTKLVGGTTTLGTQLIKPGELKAFNLTYANTSAFIGTHTLTLSAPAGEMPEQITCSTK